MLLTALQTAKLRSFGSSARTKFQGAGELCGGLRVAAFLTRIATETPFGLMKHALCIATMVLVLVAGASGADSKATVHLQSGASVSGEILDQTPDRVVVDLGATVLTLAASEIEKIIFGDVFPVDVIEVDGLFRTGAVGRARSVQENAARFGAAVVQVRTPVGLGSGFIIHPDGYVVTNDHVIAGEYELTVTVYEGNGSSLERVQYNNVRIVALEGNLDLALLKIEDDTGHEFTTVTIGDSEVLEGGEAVFAIGSPLGLERTVSQGIVSLRNRVLGGQLYIQTTAQINPGNSGGPLFNLRGEVIGVNNMKAMMVGVEGVNFAIPATTLKEFLRNRDAFAFDPRNPNSGYHYLSPPQPARAPQGSR